MEKREANILICEFMGYTKTINSKNPTYKIPDHSYEEHHLQDQYSENVDTFSVLWDDMGFHCSFDWLMPVATKLNISYISTDIDKAYKQVIYEIRKLEKH